MANKFYSVYDNKGKTYLRPMLLNHHAEAMRSFEIAVNDPQTEIGQFPSDFELYYLGDFNQDIGKFINASEPEFICHGKTLLRLQKEAQK